MRQQHPVFDRAVEPDTVLWRYMDFAKFVSMLKERALWFSRADLLGDPLEGSYTRARQARLEEALQNPPNGRTRADIEAVIERNRNSLMRNSHQLYVNCWHAGDHESMALWHTYGNGQYGVAVKSTFGLLGDLLPTEFTDALPGTSIHLGNIRYINHSSTSEEIPRERNLFAPFICKSLVYADEHEVRAIFSDVSAAQMLSEGSDPPHGHLVSVDLQNLVTSVVISPLAPAWFESVARSAFQTYGFRFGLQRSLRSAEPVF